MSVPVLKDAPVHLVGGGARLIDLPVLGDARGLLRPVDFPLGDFLPVRCFLVNGTRDTVRGGHGHLRSRQLLMCASGAVVVELCDGDRQGRWRLTPDGPLLLIEPGIWSRQEYEGSGSALMVFADLPYDPDDYFHDRPGIAPS